MKNHPKGSLFYFPFFDMFFYYIKCISYAIYAKFLLMYSKFKHIYIQKNCPSFEGFKQQTLNCIKKTYISIIPSFLYLWMLEFNIKFYHLGTGSAFFPSYSICHFNVFSFTVKCINFV